MATIKQLEKMRIEKIKSLNSSQIENYVDVIVKDICKLHNFNSVINPDERIDEISDLYYKLNEINELTGGNFTNIKNYIDIKLNTDLVIALTVENQKYIIKDANADNLSLSLLLKEIISDYLNLEMYTALLYDLVFDFKKLSAVDNKKLHYFNSLKKVIAVLKSDIENNIELIDGKFYSDETIKNDIHELKVTIKNYADSGDETDKLFVEFGLIPILYDLIKAYENHAKIKEMYIDYKVKIDELFESADNVFKKYSVDKYDAASGISFNNFMKSEPKFNINTGELISP